MDLSAHDVPRVAPGPRGRFLLGDLADLTRDALGFYRALGRRYGDVARFHLGPRVAHLANHPDAIRHVLVEHEENYRKGFGNDRLEPLIGRGLFLAEGDEWRFKRRLAQPAFSRASLDALVAPAVDATDRALDAWAPLVDRPTDLFAALQTLTLSVLTRCLLGVDVTARAGAVRLALDALWVETNRRVHLPLAAMMRWPLPANRRFARNLAVVDALVREVVARQRGAADDTLLARLVAAGMTDAALRDEVVTFLVAGLECTSIALAWTLHLLTQHPDAERRVRDEHATVLADRPPTAASLERLRYTRAVLDESLRLYPPAWVIARQANADDAVMGFAIPKDSLVLVVPWVTHRDPRWWPEPDAFVPERFETSRPPRFAYLPFGAGARMCIGRELALRVATVTLRCLLARYRVEPAPGPPVEPAPQLTLRPRHGIPVVLRQR